MIVLALDSGVERTGYAILSHEAGDPSLVAYDCITTRRADDLSIRLQNIRAAVSALIDTYKPDVCVMERLFFSKNITTGIMVAQAQGAVLALMGEHGIPTDFVPPHQVKQALTGHGNADKKSVQKMVKILLNLNEVPQPDDVADAIACGFTYCTMRSLHDRET